MDRVRGDALLIFLILHLFNKAANLKETDEREYYIAQAFCFLFFLEMCGNIDFNMFP